MLSEQHAADMARGELCLAALGVLLEVTDAAAAASDAADGEMYWVDDLTGAWWLYIPTARWRASRVPRSEA